MTRKKDPDAPSKRLIGDDALTRVNRAAARLLNRIAKKRGKP